MVGVQADGVDGSGDGSGGGPADGGVGVQDGVGGTAVVDS